jgi:predicted metal-dependent peptidase
MNKAESLAKASKDLMLREPFYGLFLIALNKKWNDNIPTACVALRRINVELHINSEFWNSKPPLVQMGVLKHELLHIAFYHLTTFRHLLEEDRECANIAMDIEINQYIDKTMLWETPEPLLPETFPDLDLEEKKGSRYYYDKLKEQKDKNNKVLQAMCAAMQAGEGSFEMPDGSTVELPQHDWKAMEDLDEATQKLVDAQVGHVLNQVVDQVQKSRGTVPGEMTSLLENWNKNEPPKFDWKGYIRRFTGKSVKIFTKKSRRKLNKRLPEFPGLKIKQQKHILCAIDTSASVNEAEVVEFMNEIYHMYKTGSEVTVLQCDTAIKHIESFNPKKPVEIHGRGGTDFQPVIDYYNEQQIKYSCLMYLTDGEAPVPENAKGNILWVLSSISKMNEDLPGSVIQLN